MKHDFSKCLINPYNEKDIKKIMSTYEEFRGIDGHLMIENEMIKYIVLMYDMNSPIRTLVSGYEEKKYKAAREAGFNLNVNRRFDEDVENALVGENQSANKAIVRYIIMHGIPELVAYTAYIEIQAAELEKALNSTTYESRELKVTRDNIDITTREIKELYKKIFGGWESQQLKNALYDTVQTDKIRLRPEHIAIDIASGTYDPEIDPIGGGKLKRMKDE
jgi:hypothetical protein